MMEESAKIDGGLVEVTDSLAAGVKSAVDSLSHLSPTELSSIIKSGIDGNIESAVNALLKSAVSFSTNLLISILVFFIGRWIIKRLIYLVEIAIVKRRVDHSVRTFLKSAISIILYLLLLLVIVQILGVNTTSLVAMLASAGLALGMALSGTLQNFAGGVMILFLKPYRVGDFITTQDESGIVKDIMLFTTVLETPNKHTIFVPNSSILSSTINNATFAENRRVDWSVGISYGDSVQVARRVILEILEADERIFKDDEQHEAQHARLSQPFKPMIGLVELGDSSVNLTVRAWVETRHYWDVYFEIYEKIYETLPQNGITFPFPQMDLHVKNDGNDEASVSLTLNDKRVNLQNKSDKE